MRVLKYLLFLLVGLASLLEEAICKTPNPYKVLGIPRDANQDQVKQGFKKRSKKYHPDRNKTDPKARDKYQKVVNAYQLLKDPERRRMYDMTGEDNPQNMGMGGGFPGGGFPGGGFGGGGFNINIEDLMKGFGGFGGGGFPGGGFQAGGGQRRTGRRQQHGGGRRTFSFTMG